MSAMLVFTHIIILAGSLMHIKAANTRISHITPGEVLVSHGAAVSFTGRLNPAVVQSHHIKMKWSKPRHYSHDQNSKDLNTKTEKNKNKLPPTLAYIITNTLSNQVFTSLVEKLPLEYAKLVMEWKDTNQLVDLEPHCEVKHNEELQKVISIQKDSFESMEQNSCHVNFTSLESAYGIKFNFTFSLQNHLMDLSTKEIASHRKPDHRGWTQPILNTDAYVYLQLYSPDFISSPSRNETNGNYKAASHNQRIKIDHKNVEEAVQSLLKKSKTVLGLMDDPHILKKSAVKDFEIIVTEKENNNKDEFYAEKEEKSDSSLETTISKNPETPSSSELIPEILSLCKKYNMNEKECELEINALEMERDFVEQQQNEPWNENESNNNNKYGNPPEMNESDINNLMNEMTAEMIASEIGDGNWDLPLEELIELKRDMNSLDRLIEETNALEQKPC